MLDGRDRLLVLHNDGAENFELVAVDPERPEDAASRDVLIPHSPATRLEDVDAVVAAWSASDGGVLDPPETQPWGERMAVVRDADGHVVCLLQQ